MNISLVLLLKDVQQMQREIPTKAMYLREGAIKVTILRRTSSSYKAAMRRSFLLWRKSATLHKDFVHLKKKVFEQWDIVRWSTKLFKMNVQKAFPLLKGVFERRRSYTKARAFSKWIESFEYDLAMRRRSLFFNLWKHYHQNRIIDVRENLGDVFDRWRNVSGIERSQSISRIKIIASRASTAALSKIFEVWMRNLDIKTKMRSIFCNKRILQARATKTWRVWLTHLKKADKVKRNSLVSTATSRVNSSSLISSLSTNSRLLNSKGASKGVSTTTTATTAAAIATTSNSTNISHIGGKQGEGVDGSTKPSSAFNTNISNPNRTTNLKSLRAGASDRSQLHSDQKSPLSNTSTTFSMSLSLSTSSKSSSVQSKSPVQYNSKSPDGCNTGSSINRDGNRNNSNNIRDPCNNTSETDTNHNSSCLDSDTSFVENNISNFFDTGSLSDSMFSIHSSRSSLSYPNPHLHSLNSGDCSFSAPVSQPSTPSTPVSRNLNKISNSQHLSASKNRKTSKNSKISRNAISSSSSFCASKLNAQMESETNCSSTVSGSISTSTKISSRGGNNLIKSNIAGQIKPDENTSMNVKTNTNNSNSRSSSSSSAGSNNNTNKVSISNNKTTASSSTKRGSAVKSIPIITNFRK